MLLTKIIGVIAITCLTGLGTNLKDSKRVIGDYSPSQLVLVNQKRAGVPGASGLIQYLWCDNATASSENIDLNQTDNPAENYNTSYEFYRCNSGDTITITPNSGYVIQAISVTGDTGSFNYADLYTFNHDTGILTLNYTNSEMAYANVQLSFYFSTISEGAGGEPTETTDYQFIINQSPNYNGVLGYSVNSFCVIKPNSASSAQFFYDIDLPTFISNGETYNQVRVLFGYADNIRYMNSAGELVVNSTNGLSFAQSIIYKNTETDTARTVYKRLEGYTTDNNGASLHYWTMNWSWSNEKYRTLNFTEELSSSQETELTQLNTGYSTLYINATTDVGLGGAMTLIGAGFSAVTSLLAISVFPGISLGLLLFLPLIVGIIIAVIWVVKR